MHKMKLIAIFIVLTTVGLLVSAWSSQQAQPNTPELAELHRAMESQDSFTQEEFEELKAKSQAAVDSIEPEYGSRAFGGMVLKKAVVVPTLMVLFGLFGRFGLAPQPSYAMGLASAILLVAFGLLSNLMETAVYSLALVVGWYSKRLHGNA
ncbi:hypothetical protein F6455_02830 [Proteobacteria bacterium 005FR1]|nr:hypothetical protein [Proteobacteria bacterium 005FR1]